MRRFAVPMVLGALALTAVTSRADAQANIFFGGGPSFATGDFGDVAKNGWLLQGGIGLDIGSKGLFIEAEGFFGSHSHDNLINPNAKEQTNIIAFMGRSEERRVGKEWRRRGEGDDEKERRSRRRP